MIDLSVLVTESRNKETMGLDQMTPLEIVTVMNREDGKAVEAVEEVLPQIAQAIVWCTDSLKQKGRIIYIGAGTSGRLGVLDAVECPSPPSGVSPDVVVGLMAGGTCLCQGSGGSRGQPDHGEEDLEGDSSVPGRYRHQAGCQRKDALCDIRPSGMPKDWMQNSGRVLQSGF